MEKGKMMDSSRKASVKQRKEEPRGRTKMKMTGFVRR